MNAQSERPDIPGYELMERLGGRRLGVVYKARQISLNRMVALRILDPVSSEDPIRLRRLRSQAQAATLHHGNLVHVIEVGEHGGYHYLVMEHVSGFSLANRIAQGDLMRASDARLTLRAVAEALDYVYRKAGIVHADLRPENIMVDDDGTIKVSDFLGFCLLDPGSMPEETAEESAANPYYVDDASGTSPAHPEPFFDIQALGRLLVHAVTGTLLEPNATADRVCALFLETSRSHPDAETREESAVLAHTLLDLIHAGPGKGVEHWGDVLAASSPTAPTPRPEPEPELEATQVIPSLAGQRPAAGMNPIRLRPKATTPGNASAGDAPPVSRRDRHPLREPSRFPSRLALGAVILLVSGGLFWADYHWHIFDPIRDFRDAKLGPPRRPPTQDPAPQLDLDVQLPPPTGEPHEAQDAEEAAEAPSAKEHDETPAADAQQRERLNAYLDGMQTILAQVAQRDLLGVNTSVDDWLARQPADAYAGSMRENKPRALAISRTYLWLQANAQSLQGLAVSEEKRQGRIDRFNPDGLVLTQQRGDAQIEFDLSFHELSSPNLVRLVHHTNPGPNDEHLFAALMAAGRFEEAAQELERLTLSPERTAFLRAWQKDWSEAHLNLQALRVLSTIEADLENNRPVQARERLKLAEPRFGQTDVFSWAEQERIRRLVSQIRGDP